MDERMVRLLKRTLLCLLPDRRGATALEYCLIAGLIALGLVGVVSQIGQTTNSHYVAVQDGFE